MKNLGKKDIFELNSNSIIDRLVGGTDTIIDLKQSVMQDLMNLLNAKIDTKLVATDHFNELNTSILTYGLPNFSLFETSSQNNMGEHIKQIIEKTLNRHEPRLKNINVTVTDIAKYSINFTINAAFMTDPEPINVQFDSKCQPDSQQFNVKEHHHE
jgi:type VI secretion system lysozyme-like protein